MSDQFNSVFDCYWLLQGFRSALYPAAKRRCRSWEGPVPASRRQRPLLQHCRPRAQALTLQQLQQPQVGYCFTEKTDFCAWQALEQAAVVEGP